jgi:hypothetical protein
MDDIFLRKYSLTIGREIDLIQKTVPSTTVKPGGEESTPLTSGANLSDGSYKDFVTKPSKGITLTDLRITADITDSKAGTTNKQKTTIQIFNLSETNQKFIRSDDTVLLKAGYEIDGQELPLVFAGQVTSVTTTKKGPDIITKLVCEAAKVARKNIKFSKKPIRGETSRDIANYFAGVAAKNGIPTGSVFVPIPNEYPGGLSAAGSLFPAMEEFCDKINLKVYVTLGKLYIEPIDLTPATVALNIEAENIKGTIRSQDDSAGKTTKQSKQGIEFTVFLDGRITAATVVNIKFGVHAGEYKVLSVKFKMDYEGSNWDTTVSCERRK